MHLLLEQAYLSSKAVTYTLTIQKGSDFVCLSALKLHLQRDDIVMVYRFCACVTACELECSWSLLRKALPSACHSYNDDT